MFFPYGTVAFQDEDRDGYYRRNQVHVQWLSLTPVLTQTPLMCSSQVELPILPRAAQYKGVRGSWNYHSTTIKSIQSEHYDNDGDEGELTGLSVVFDTHHKKALDRVDVIPPQHLMRYGRTEVSAAPLPPFSPFGRAVADCESPPSLPLPCSHSDWRREGPTFRCW